MDNKITLNLDLTAEECTELAMSVMCMQGFYGLDKNQRDKANIYAALLQKIDTAIKNADKEKSQ